MISDSTAANRSSRSSGVSSGCEGRAWLLRGGHGGRGVERESSARISVVGRGAGGARRTIGRVNSSGRVKIRSSTSCGASGSGISFGLPERAEVSTAQGDRQRTARKRRTERDEVTALQSRNISAWRRSIPSRSAARAMSISRKVRPHQEVGGFGGNVLGKLCQALGGNHAASPRLRPRHIRLVMAPSDILRASSETSPPTEGANICASSTTTNTGYQYSTIGIEEPLRNAPAHASALRYQDLPASGRRRHGAGECVWQCRSVPLPCARQR